MINDAVVAVAAAAAAVLLVWAAAAVGGRGLQVLAVSNPSPPRYVPALQHSPPPFLLLPRRPPALFFAVDRKIGPGVRHSIMVVKELLTCRVKGVVGI